MNSVIVLFSGFCHVYGRFSYVKSDFTELKSFSSGKFKGLNFANVTSFAACKLINVGFIVLYR